MHSNFLYDKIKEFQPKAHKVMQQIKSKQGVLLHEKEEVLERWAEYVEELYEDARRGVADIGDLINEKYAISREEVAEVISKLPKGKAVGEDNIPAKIIKCVGEEGLKIITKMINLVYISGYIRRTLEKVFSYQSQKPQKQMSVVISVQLR